MIPQTISSTETLRQFADDVYRNTGAIIQPIADSELHRFDDPEGKRGNLAGWYVLHLDSYPAGAYGSWRTGTQYTWRLDSERRPDPAEQARTAAIVRAARVRRDQEKAQWQAQAATLAKALWRDAVPATVAHPYIKSKRIPAIGLRQTGPAHPAGAPHLTGAPTRGHYHRAVQRDEVPDQRETEAEASL